MRDKKKHAEKERYRQQAHKVWRTAYGPIPKDDRGNPFQIHHKDRDWRNNSLDNLECISRRDHDIIHHDERIIWNQRIHKGRRQSAEEKEKHKLALLGIKRSTETRAKIATARRGKPLSEETKRKLAAALMGKNKGRKKSAEEIARREATKATNRIGNPDYGNKYRKAHKSAEAA